MPSLLLHKETSSQQQLKRLIQVRWFYIIVQFTAIIAATHLTATLPHYWPMLIIIAVETLVNLYGTYQISKDSKLNISRLTESHIWQHLLFDIAAISSLLYFNGGATSGFVSVLLLPVTLTALLCSYRRAIISAAIAISCYSIMMKYYANFKAVHIQGESSAFSNHHHLLADDAMQTHFLGMWLTFTVSTLLLVYFISRLSELLSLQQLKISQQHEQQLIDEHILELAIASANAAHQLSTPLNSLQLAVEELKETNHEPELTQCISDQLNRCQHIVSQIRTDAERTKIDGPQQLSVHELLERLKQHWLINFPTIALQISYSSNESDPVAQEKVNRRYRLNFERGLIPALLNLLDNAVKNHHEIDDSANDNNEATPTEFKSNSIQTNNIEVVLWFEKEQLHFIICNHSKDVNLDLLKQLGKHPVNNSQGMGIGFLLANSTIERLGGKVWLTPTEKDIIETRVTFPILDSDGYTG